MFRTPAFISATLPQVAILAVLACCPAPAATLQQLSMDEMSQASTAIVRATITGSSASFTGSTIYTHYKLQISETWKGFPTAEVMLPGGVSGSFRQTFPGVPQLKTGSEYVLFLWTSSTGITHIIGLTQGLFDVSRQTDGSIQASRAQIGETMLNATGQQVRDQAIQMKLGDLKTRVNQAMTARAAKQ